MKIRVSDVAFEYPERPVLDHVSFAVRAGTLVGVLGPNGAGKSTLLRCMHAALEPSHGGVLVDGADLATMSRRDVALRVGVVPQSCSPGFQVTVAEFVGMGRYARESFLGAPSTEDVAAVRRALADVDMTEHAARSVHELSGGEFRRVLIAQALAQEAGALLLDEPVQQLDLLHQLEVMELVRRIARRPGAAAVVVLHDLGLAARYCDELLLLDAGRVAAVGAPEDVITEDNLRTVYGVEAAVDRCPETGAVRVVPLRPVAARATEIVEGRTR
jgi:iron complex transport system ATP-binding protein